MTGDYNIALGYAMENSIKKAIGSMLILQAVSNDFLCVPQIFYFINEQFAAVLHHKFSVQYKTVVRLYNKGLLISSRKRDRNNQLMDFYTVTEAGASKLRSLKQQYCMFIEIINAILNNNQPGRHYVDEKDPIFLNQLKKFVCPLLVLFFLSQSDQTVSQISFEHDLFHFACPDETIYSLLKDGYLIKYKKKDECNHTKNYYSITSRGRVGLYYLMNKYRYLTNRVFMILGECGTAYE